MTPAAIEPAPGEPYGRTLLTADDDHETLIMRWRPGATCAPHDHGDAGGAIHLLEGAFVERRYRHDADGLSLVAVYEHEAPAVVAVEPGCIHDMRSLGEGTSVHRYSPRIAGMRVYDVERRETLVVSDDCGAWVPRDEALIVAREPLAGAAVILITYTTLYREGGAQIEQAAETLAKEKRAARPGAEVRLARVESKRAFVDAIAASEAAGGLDELHFLGHSGMYGPMFRTTAMPEQLSPHEWRTLRIPFKPGGQAFFHACRTARWFAPFFARTFGVPAHGFHWYTSFSRRADRFRWPGLAYPKGAPLYLIGVKGKKSHGLLGTLGKYAGLAGAEPMRRYEPAPVEGDASYDSVADLYDAVFDDIRVREDEWRWLEAHIPRSPAPRVLDLGCGNGALLQALAGRVASGHGVDASAGMIRAATRRNRAAHLAFTTIDGPALPFPDASFDVVVSLLSFRYLDWDPVMNEVRRVLAPGGRLLVVDMVTAPVTAKEAPRFLRDTARGAVGRVRRPAFGRALGRLVKDPRWATMLAYNPIRAQHELVWYLESRFPGRRVELLNVGFHARVLAFDSGPLEPGAVAPQSYP